MSISKALFQQQYNMSLQMLEWLRNIFFGGGIKITGLLWDHCRSLQFVQLAVGDSFKKLAEEMPCRGNLFSSLSDTCNTASTLFLTSRALSLTYSNTPNALNDTETAT